jgi:hypothetical protein
MGFAPAGEETPMKTAKRPVDIADIADMPARSQCDLADIGMRYLSTVRSAKTVRLSRGMSAKSAKSAKQGSSPEPETSRPVISESSGNHRLRTARFGLNAAAGEIATALSAMAARRRNKSRHGMLCLVARCSRRYRGGRGKRRRRGCPLFRHKIAESE